MTTTDLSRYQDPLTIQRVLLSAKGIAVVGLSGNVLRARREFSAAPWSPH